MQTVLGYDKETYELNIPVPEISTKDICLDEDTGVHESTYFYLYKEDKDSEVLYGRFLESHDGLHWSFGQMVKLVFDGHIFAHSVTNEELNEVMCNSVRANHDMRTEAIEIILNTGELVQIEEARQRQIENELENDGQPTENEELSYLENQTAQEEAYNEQDDY